MKNVYVRETDVERTVVDAGDLLLCISRKKNKNKKYKEKNLFFVKF